VAIAFAGALLMLYRYRINKSEQIRAAVEELSRSRQERLLELERVRSRIAADLHDDIGSSLSQIAVLSEFAKHGNGHKETGPDTLEQISEVSNELVEAMSDIVWAIDPRKDNFHDVLQRMRRFAADIFTAKGIKFRFDAPEFDERVQFGADVRRELFVIYKEAVNNIARHSGANQASIRIYIVGESLSLEISDNGHGFDVEGLNSSTFSPGMGGNGLANIRKRAAGLGADLKIESSEHGTHISLTLAVSHAAARNFTYPHG
jgi:signal transduction histidine kinase